MKIGASWGFSAVHGTAPESRSIKNCLVVNIFFSETMTCYKKIPLPLSSSCELIVFSDI